LEDEVREKIYKAVFVLGFASFLFYVALGKDAFSGEMAKEILESSMNFNREKELEESETEVSEMILSGIQEPVSRKDPVINASQCLWGTWRLTQKFWGGEGFLDCEDGDEMKDLEATFLPDKIIFGNTTAEVSKYASRLAGVYKGDDEELKYAAGYPVGDAKLCGIKGSYVLEVAASFDGNAIVNYPDSLFSRVTLISDEEMILFDGNARYKAVKIQDCEAEKDAGFKVWERVAEFAQGCWKITEAIGSRDDSEIEDGEIGKLVGVYIINFLCCRGYSSNDDRVRELAEWLDISDKSSLVVIYELSGDFEWDEMIIRDEMHAIFIKGDAYYLAERESPENPIYYETF